eukprot:GHUV01055764.1.p1 GENE.GHUV01055764.1~~GHUV01055764.1.p1  ORF type:complete len:143 (+),score=23.14 GHUV01055764.1:65-493(+)
MYYWYVCKRHFERCKAAKRQAAALSAAKGLHHTQQVTCRSLHASPLHIKHSHCQNKSRLMLGHSILTSFRACTTCSYCGASAASRSIAYTAGSTYTHQLKLHFCYNQLGQLILQPSLAAAAPVPLPHPKAIHPLSNSVVTTA